MMLRENPSAFQDFTIMNESFLHIPTHSEHARYKAITPVRYNRVRLNVALKDSKFDNKT